MTLKTFFFNTLIGASLIIVSLPSAWADDPSDLVNAMQNYSQAVLTNAPGISQNNAIATNSFLQNPNNGSQPSQTSLQAPDLIGKNQDSSAQGDLPVGSQSNVLSRYLIIVALFVFTTVTAAGIRFFLKIGAKSTEYTFRKQFSSFNYAAVANDPHSFVKGKFKLEYPKLRVGEFTFDITGSRITGSNLLQLRNEVVLKFYTDNSVVFEDRSSTRRPFNVVKEEKAAPKRSIFD